MGRSSTTISATSTASSTRFTSDGFSYRELRDYVEFVRAELLRVPQVGKVDLIGVQDEVAEHRLLDAADGGLEHQRRPHRGNDAQPERRDRIGRMETSNERIAIRVSGPLDSRRQLENVSDPRRRPANPA